MKVLGYLLSCVILVSRPIIADESGPSIMRFEYVVSGEKPIRLSRLLEVRQKGEERFRTHYLLSVGDELFYEGVEVDQKDRSRRFWLETGKKEESSEFSIGPRVEALTRDEVEKRIGLLRVGQNTLRVAVDDASRLTVKVRVRSMLDGWRAEKLDALRRIFTTMAACNVEMGRGDLLSLFFPDVVERTTPCPQMPTASEPDPMRDRKFILLEPSLTDVLKRPAKLTSGIADKKVQ